MTYQAQAEKSKQNNNRRAQNSASANRNRTNTGAAKNSTGRVQNGAHTYNRSTAKSAQGKRPASGHRSANLPAERKVSTFSILRKNLRPILLVRQDRVDTVKSSTKNPFPLGAVVMVTVCTFLLMFTIMSYVQINEYTIEVAHLRGELTELANEKKELDRALDDKNDMLKIEEYATGNLGMVKSDQLTKKHITIEQE
ncbi:MAG: hypothetical protein IKU19_00760, partial [Clostridia bacterium]|nr:hypothetical protein [Clostridia bacterium]